MQKVDEKSRLAEVAVERLNWTRNYTNMLLEGIPDEKLTARAGDKGNHALWVMGHVALTDDQMLAAIAGKAPTLPESFGKLFGPGSQPSDSASDYPTRAELVEALRTTREALCDWVATIDDEAGREALPEAFRPFAPDVGSLPFGISAHELFHAGQVASVRSYLGIAPHF